MTTTEITFTLLDQFHAAVKDTSESNYSYTDYNRYSIPLGAYIEAEACHDEVLSWVDARLSGNRNSTFYGKWQDILLSSRAELLMDQLKHYASTYGTAFEGKPYIPNDGEEVTADMMKNLIFIRAVTEEEMSKMCYDVLCSGIALKQNVVEVLTRFVIYNYPEEIDINEVKNREAQAIFADLMHIYPTDRFMLMRLLSYKYTDSPMIIHNDSYVNRLKENRCRFFLHNLDNEHLVELSKCFLRYKWFFMALRCPQNNPVINRLRKMARKNHVPMKESVENTIFSKVWSTAELLKTFRAMPSYRLVSLWTECNYRLSQPSDSLYLIRNGKLWMKESNGYALDRDYLKCVQYMLKWAVTDRLSANVKGKVIDLPENISYALPTSQKNFVGNIPFGTAFKKDGSNYIGIYWRNEWGTHDYDLSCLYNGCKIGWNSQFTDGAAHSIVYSGDMTNADPEATEVLYFKKDAPKGFIMVNQYRGESKSKFRLLFGRQENMEISENMIIPDNTVELVQDIEHENQRQITVGCSDEEAIYICSFGSGNDIVSSSGTHAIRMQEALIRKASCYPRLTRELLESAGAIIADDKIKDVDIDLKAPTADTFINLLS